jgi:hypothetical protein
LDDLANMPFQQYQVVRRAAELIEIQARLQLIMDVNAGFHGTKGHIQKLEQALQKAQGSGIQMQADKNWVDRIKQLAG